MCFDGGMTTNTETSAERSQRFYSQGLDAGAAAASWVIDGNTTQATARHLVALFDAGDPALDDLVSMPSPLSGEWAGESMVEILGEGHTDDDADSYEEGFADAFWGTVEADARLLLDDEPVPSEASRYAEYVAACDAEGLGAHSLAMWRVHEEPAGPLG